MWVIVDIKRSTAGRLRSSALVWSRFRAERCSELREPGVDGKHYELRVTLEVGIHAVAVGVFQSLRSIPGLLFSK